MIRRTFNWLTGLPPPSDQRPRAADAEIRNAGRGVAVHHLVYEKKRQPDPAGAANYAYELLQLVPFSPINRGVRVRLPIVMPFGPPQIYAGQALKINPIASMAGGLFSGGMIESDGSLPDLGTKSTVNMFAVATNNANAGANDVSGVYGDNDPMGGGN